MRTTLIQYHDCRSFVAQYTLSRCSLSHNASTTTHLLSLDGQGLSTLCMQMPNDQALEEWRYSSLRCLFDEGTSFGCPKNLDPNLFGSHREPVSRFYQVLMCGAIDQSCYTSLTSMLRRSVCPETSFGKLFAVRCNGWP